MAFLFEGAKIGKSFYLGKDKPCPYGGQGQTLPVQGLPKSDVFIESKY